MPVKPYSQNQGTKKKQVEEMFDNISSSYDFLNHFLSLGIDRSWRKIAIKRLASLKPKRILDVATGTGDFAIEASRLDPERIVGIDISAGMLDIGREKMKKKNLSQKIEMIQADTFRFDTEREFAETQFVSENDHSTIGQSVIDAM